MEITIELETCILRVCIKPLRRYAVFIDRITGNAINMSIPELIKALELVAQKTHP